MATQTWVTTLSHTTDAEFRAWGLELSQKLAAAGLVQTADTGQINWGTVTRPGTSTMAGYEIWRFNDPLQASAPIFIKILYGTATSANTPRIDVQVGTGSNGSGTITGTAQTPQRQITANSGISGNAHQSFVCVVPGFFGLGWKIGAGTRTFFGICRSCDGTGAPDGRAAIIYFGTAGVQCLRFAAPAAVLTFTSNARFALVPWDVTNSTAGGSATQVFKHWMITPAIEPVFGACTVVRGELGQGTQFSIALVGATARTYIALGDTNVNAEAGNAPTVYGFAMLWE